MTTLKGRYFTADELLWIIKAYVIASGGTVNIPADSPADDYMLRFQVSDDEANIQLRAIREDVVGHA
jgi:hypothetical protein